MPTINHMEFLSSLSCKAMYLLRNLTFSVAPFYKKSLTISDFNQFVTIQLFTDIYSTSESIFMLVKEFSLWDADDLLRIVIEGSIKYIYLMSGQLKEDSDIIKEFYYTIPEIQKISEHKKAKDALGLFHLYSDQKHPFEVSILSEEEIELLEIKYPSKVRREIDTKWGFGKILKILIEKDIKYESLVGLYYAYSLSSHFIHFDGNYVRMRHESMLQNACEENYILDLAHAVRILSNVLSLGLIRVSEYISKYEIEAKEYSEKIQEVITFLNELEDISQDFVHDKF